MTRRTALFLLRLRYLQRDGGAPTLAEETVAWGVRGVHPDVTVLDLAEASHLLDTVQAAGSVPAAEKREVLAETLGWWPLLVEPLAELLAQRSSRLAEEHARLGALLGADRTQIEAQAPPDLLGVVVLLPAVGAEW